MANQFTSFPNSLDFEAGISHDFVRPKSADFFAFRNVGMSVPASIACFVTTRVKSSLDFAIASNSSRHPFQRLRTIASSAHSTQSFVIPFANDLVPNPRAVRADNKAGAASHPVASDIAPKA